MILGTWILRATPDELDAIREFISVPPVNVREHGGIEGISLYGWLFNRPNDPQGRRSPLHVRNRTLIPAATPEQSGAPLFSGDWMLRYPPGQSGVRREHKPVLRLSINPLRFVRHQSIPRPIGPPATWPLRMTRRESVESNSGEFALDGEDNWLPDLSIWAAFASPDRWQHHLRRCVRGITGSMNSELARVIAHRGGEVTCREGFSLRKVETAFEFAATEPTELVRSLVPLLSSYRADNVNVTEHQMFIAERVENSLCLRLRIRQGVSLRVYAKTNRRVRFEIIHDEINHRELLGISVPPQIGINAAQLRPLNDLFPCLSALRQRSADEMNALFAHCRSRRQIVPSHISPLSFLVSVSTILRDRELAHTVVSLLTNGWGGIASRRASPELLEALHALSSAGILSYERFRRGYDVTDPYKEALNVLRAHGSLHLLTTARERTRRRRQN